MSAQTEYQLLVANTPEDYGRFQRDYAFRLSGAFWRLAPPIVYLLALFAIFIPLTAGVLLLIERLVLGFELFGGGEIPVLLGLAAAYVVYFKTVRYISSFFWKPDLSSFTVPTTYVVSSEGLRTSSENGESLMRWRAIKEIAVIRDTIYLSLGAGTAIVIPKRSFASPAAAEGMVAFAREQIALHKGTVGVFV